MSAQKNDPNSLESIELGQPIAARRESLSKRFIKCGKPGCGCAESKEKRHGPYFSLVRVINGKTSSRYISPEQAEIAQRQIKAGKILRKSMTKHWEDCEAIADAELQAIENDQDQKKKDSRSQSNRKSKLK